MSNNNDKKTILELILDKGYSRKDFIKFCGYAAGIAGVGLGNFKSLVAAMETKTRPPIIWLHFQECTCCSESFIRATHPIVADILLDLISLDYSETLMAAAGHQAEKVLYDSMKENYGKYILTVEGAIPTADGGVYCTIGGKTAQSILGEATKGAAAILAWGSCASNGCVQAAKPNPTGATPIHKLTNKNVIKVPGCPPIADVMMAVIVHMLLFGTPQTDMLGRPKEFYGRRVHDTCYRRPNFDAGLFVNSWDDEGARAGYCLYKMGCKGPTTYNACAVTKWNGGTSFPIQSGHGCFGCSEENFWDVPLYERAPKLTAMGYEATADKIGMVAGVATAVGVAAHAVTTNIRKRDLIHEGIEDSEKE